MLLGYAQINSKHSLMGFTKDQTIEAEGKVCDIHFQREKERASFEGLNCNST